MNLPNQVFSRFCISKISVFLWTTITAVLLSVGINVHSGSPEPTAYSDTTQAHIETPVNIPTLAQGNSKVDLGANLAKPKSTPHLLGGWGNLQAMVNNNPAAYNYLTNTNKDHIVVKLMTAKAIFTLAKAWARPC